MRPFVLPALERLARRVLHKRGIQSRFIKTPMGKLHVYDAVGRGTLHPIVLLHGLSSSGTPFGPLLLRLLGDARRVVVPDYPGHGFSERSHALTAGELFESVDVALRTLGVGPAILVGNSLGGAVALHRAVENPDQVRALVLVSPAGARSSDEEWTTLLKKFDIRTRADGATFARRLYHEPPKSLALFAHELPALMGRPAVREILSSASNDVLPTPESLGKLAMPILLLWGKGERLLPEAHYQYFVAHLPKQTEIARPETYAHCPHFDQPRDLARRIVAFAREHLDGASVTSLGAKVA